MIFKVYFKLQLPYIYYITYELILFSIYNGTFADFSFNNTFFLLCDTPSNKESVGVFVVFFFLEIV